MKDYKPYGLSLGPIQTKQIVSYMLMPQIWPRLREFYKNGFSRLAEILAVAYQALGLLPANHPIFAQAAHSNLTLRGVLAAAGSQLVFKRENLDKILLYFLSLTGLVMGFCQIFLALAYVLINPALAQVPTNYGEFFATPRYTTDIAYKILYSVFGIPELFNTSGEQSNYHVALQSLFQFYSIGMLVIAAIILCYYIFVIAIETAQTGVPFGKRFNHVWAPIRLVVALGLLIPMGYGLNAAQWITLYAAKFGSDFATKGWILFNDEMNGPYLNDKNERIGRPQTPDLMPLVRFMTAVSACNEAYFVEYNGTQSINAYIIHDSAASTGATPLSRRSNFDNAYKLANHGDILIRFGEYDPSKHKQEAGYVLPLCGEIKISTGDITESGSKIIQKAYFDLINTLFMGTSYDVRQLGVDLYRQYIQSEWTPITDAQTVKSVIAGRMDDYADRVITRAINEMAKSSEWENERRTMVNLGWGGAGIWYNKIAQMNGSLVSAVNAIPVVTREPLVLEHLKLEKAKASVSIGDDASANQPGNSPVTQDTKINEKIADGLTYADDFWGNEDLRQGTYASQTKATANWFINAINLIFGTRGLFNMCANADIHPLAQLSILGKGLMDASIRNIALSMGFGVMSALPIPYLGQAAGIVSGFLSSVATMTLTLGFLMFYVLPFFPFLYFFFAVGGWVKGLFEAMVGLPLWALAHLHIDGDGLPGSAAKGGYLMILEIFLRPILIIFGLLASVIIFSAMVRVLNDIFTLVVSNLSGHDEGFTTLCNKTSPSMPTAASSMAFFRGPIDELFYTVLYAIVVYMIGMSCFKLIDLIPNNLLRYMGEGVSTFNDKSVDPAQGLMSSLAIGTTNVSNNLIGLGRGAVTSIGQIGKGVSELVTPEQPKPPQSGP